VKESVLYDVKRRGRGGGERAVLVNNKGREGKVKKTPLVAPSGFGSRTAKTCGKNA